MSSKPRIILQNVVYQVRAEAARNEKIFKDETMRVHFCKLLENKLKTHSFQCYGYSIEDSHYHLALKTGSITISRFLQKIDSSFARYYNKKLGTRGAVFARPFTSLIIEEKMYLKELVRYIHLNPVRCNSCTIKELETYKWCGHHAHLTASTESLQNSSYFLQTFTEKDRLSAYEEFVKRGFSNTDPFIQQIRNANSGKQRFANPKHQIAGSDQFVKWAITEDQCRKTKIPRHQFENVSLHKIHEKIEGMFNLKSGELYRQGRSNQRSIARELFAYIARNRFDYSGVEVAQYLNKTDSAVSRMISRFEFNEKKDKLVGDIAALIIDNEEVTVP